MNIKLKTALITASIVLLLIAAVLVVFIGRKSENYEDRLMQAGVYLENRDYDNAIAIYNGIISENRSCAEAYAGLSEAYFAKSRTDKALEILEKGAANTDNDRIITDKRNELFPDMQYADIDYDDDDYYTYDDYGDDLSEDADLTAEISAPESDSEAESSETESAVTTVPEESESETTVTTTAATTVPTTAATTVPTTTAAPVIVTTALPVTTQATTRATTTPTTVTTTTVTTTTEALKDVSVPDLTRMSIDEAYAWCSKNNIILNVVGTENDSSKILSQSPAPNATVKENSSVIVVLEE